MVLMPKNVFRYISDLIYMYLIYTYVYEQTYIFKYVQCRITSSENVKLQSL